MTSARSTPPAALVDRVRVLAVELREWPSQRRVMRECRIGAPRAGAALTALRAEGFDPAAPATLAVVRALPAPPHERPHALDSAGSERAVQTRPRRTLNASTSSRRRTHGTRPRRTSTAPTSEPRNTPKRTRWTRLTTQPRPTQIALSAADSQVGGAAGVVKPPRGRRVPRWPLLVIAAGAFVSIWSGWVGLGKLTGFGPVVLLPGIADEWTINSAITLPLGVEAYAAFAMWAWLSNAPVSARARTFARRSALSALLLGMTGQATYHLMVAAGVERAPWPITAFVACLPVVVLGCGAALAHLIREAVSEHDADPADQ